MKNFVLIAASTLLLASCSPYTTSSIKVNVLNDSDRAATIRLSQFKDCVYASENENWPSASLDPHQTVTVLYDYKVSTFGEILTAGLAAHYSQGKPGSAVTVEYADSAGNLAYSNVSLGGSTGDSFDLAFHAVDIKTLFSASQYDQLKADWAANDIAYLSDNFVAFAKPDTGETVRLLDCGKIDYPGLQAIRFPVLRASELRCSLSGDGVAGDFKSWDGN
jgi:hypothetical protein